MAPVCDRNCFTCPYEDCICDDITYEDFRAEKEIDLMSGAKVYKTSSKARAIQKRYREENKEKVAAAQKRYYEENKEKVAAAQKRYREENKEKVAAARKRYREENKEKVAAAQKRYYEENKEKWKLYNAKRRKKQNAKS